MAPAFTTSAASHGSADTPRPHPSPGRPASGLRCRGLPRGWSLTPRAKPLTTVTPRPPRSAPSPLGHSKPVRRPRREPTMAMASPSSRRISPRTSRNGGPGDRAERHGILRVSEEHQARTAPSGGRRLLACCLPPVEAGDPPGRLLTDLGSERGRTSRRGRRAARGAGGRGSAANSPRLRGPEPATPTPIARRPSLPSRASSHPAQ